VNGHRNPLWKIAQLAGVIATVVLLAGLVRRPDPSLTLLWKILIPLVPASLLVNPNLWRNTCPLATLNLLATRFSRGRVPSSKWIDRAGTLGIALLVVLVPARRFLFNENGPVLGLTVLAVAIVALALGARYDVKAGFCNAFCPVLPVEKLYGQRPLIQIDNARCPACTVCTRGCLDLSTDKSVSHLLGRARHSLGWMVTPYGAFAAAFPGFVLGYFTTTDVPFSQAGSIYLWIAAWSLGSYLLTAVVVQLSGVRWESALPTLAALAVGSYYWFAAPDLAAALRVGGAGLALRFLALATIVAWWWRAARGAPSEAARP
jgi:Pyruvate/2-oxoacid:ferredoxin oxidoreductase delta subunit